MLFYNYLIGKFLRNLFFISLFFGVLIFVAQLFPVIHLLDFGSGIICLLLIAIHTFVISLGASIFIAAADFIQTLKEGKVFHILYTFGISEKKVLNLLWKIIFFISALGILSSTFINYQKISYLLKYIKFEYSQKFLLTVPPDSFASKEGFSFFYTQKDGNTFENIVMKIDKKLITAKRAQFNNNGTLVLKQTSVFVFNPSNIRWMDSKKYIFSLQGSFTYHPKPKRFLENMLFLIGLFSFPILIFPFFFYVIFNKAKTKFRAYIWAILFLIIQFAIALVAKSIV